MKRYLAIAATAVISSAVSAFASGNNHSGSSSAAPAVHSSSSAPSTAAVAPRFSGGAMPHYSRSMPYRPTVSYSNGNRTFNYPAVGVSNMRRLPTSNANNFKSPRVLQSNAANFQRTAGNLNRTSGNPQHGAALNLAGKKKLDPQTSARLRNWSGNPSSTAQAHQNHWNNCHNHHDHWWWRNHCVAFIFFDWGWWGWYDGWWYPAWGYDSYSYYPYNEPIYGDGDLSPEQIVAGVQVALQQRGYYSYEIDGRMGPLTRAAIARYQSDNRLPITSGIDAATLGSLGVIR